MSEEWMGPTLEILQVFGRLTAAVREVRDVAARHEVNIDIDYFIARAAEAREKGEESA